MISKRHTVLRRTITLAAVSCIALTAHAAQKIQISGVYPHLCTYSQYRPDGSHQGSGSNECGIGAVVPWADKLWMINYAPHRPEGSDHKLYSIDENLNISVFRPDGYLILG